MNTCLKLNLDDSTVSVRIKLENGSQDSAFEMSANRLPKPSEMDMSVRPQAANPEHSSTFGIDPKRQPYSTECSIQGPFSIRSNNSIGQEIAQVICKVITENEGLLV